MNRGTLRRSPSTPVMNQPSGSLTISSIETPSPNGTNALNRPAQPSQSLYQLCLELLKRLYCVDGFEQYLEQGHRNIQNNASIGTPTSETLPNGILHGDPVTLLWQTFRLGYPLCALFNAMKPEKQIPLEFTEPPNLSKTSIQATTNKKSVYHFLVKCKEELGLKQDEMFQITSLFKDDTNDFVKVINTVKCVVDKIEEKDLLNLSRRELLGNSDPMKPTDNRARVVQEILETERKYVYDMEVLQDYARKLQSAEVVSVDTIHHLFANLNQLVDFQRRFLIGVEHHASLSPSEQRFGYLFVQMEENFEVYQPFCANYQSASELVIQETPNLQKLKDVVEPTYELPSLLIKPIQRICKYPLLLQELLKYTEKTNNPYYEEIERGLKAIKRVADRVNETRRLQENEAVVKDLERRVEDWKGHDISSFGSLLLEDVFVMSKDDSEREYHVYLFERILLCCKETAKQNARGPVLRGTTRRQKRASLQLKGRIFIHNITAVLDNSRSGSWSLKVYWRGDTEMESFSLKCRNEEQLKQWQATLEKLLQENRNNQSTNSSKGSSDTPSSAIRRTGVSNTQLASLQNLDLPPYSRRKNLDDDDDSDDDNDDDNASFMEDEEEDGEEEDDDDDYDWAMKQSRSQSLPYGQFPSHNFGRKSRPDESTAVSSPYNFRSDTVPIPNMPPSHQQQYHRHPNNMSMPPLPRNGFTTAPPSTTMFPSAALQNEYGHNNPNSNHNYNNYIPSSPPQSHSGSPAQSARSSGSAGSHSMSIWQRRSIEHPSPLTDTIAKFMAEEKEFVPQQQQPSFQRAQSVSASSGHIFQQVNNQPPQYPAHAHPISRLRSQSSPNIHVIQETSWDTTEPVPDLQNASLSQSDNSRFRSPQQRNSGSSTSSQHSIHTSTTSPTGSISSHTLTSPISNGSTNGHHHSSFGYASASFSNTMKIKINFAEYVFLIVVPQETDYQELCERIERKIRSCPSGRDESLQIRIKYQDEDGDYITINSNEDIQMAFDGRNFVNLYVSN